MKKSKALYSDFEPFVAEWLRRLVSGGMLPPGDVKDEDVRALAPETLTPYRQVHLFAGIGGWPLALQMAGWPEDRPVWTMSLPCQPFSTAGSRHGTADSRHLWPTARRLISECAPPVVFGEQVASALGRDWMSAVRADLEGMGYAVGIADLCAAGVGAPHIRQRLFWVAHASIGAKGSDATRKAGRVPGEGASDDLGKHRGYRRWPVWADGGRGRLLFVPCLDGKARPFEPGILPVAHGVPDRVGKIRGYGNAIVPQVAAVFIKAFLDAVGSP